MKKLFLILIAGFALWGGAGKAMAFSTEQPAAQNDQGGAKFADPDEQMPAFMVLPDQAEAAHGALSFGSPGVNMPQPGEYDSGAAAFDHAFNHQQDK